MAPRKTISLVAPNRDAIKRRAPPKPKKRKATAGKRGWTKSIRIRNEMAIIDGQQRMSVIRFFFESLRRARRMFDGQALRRAPREQRSGATPSLGCIGSVVRDRASRSIAWFAPTAFDQSAGRFCNNHLPHFDWAKSWCISSRDAGYSELRCNRMELVCAFILSSKCQLANSDQANETREPIQRSRSSRSSTVSGDLDGPIPF